MNKNNEDNITDIAQAQQREDSNESGLVGSDGNELNVKQRKAEENINFTPHPNTIFASRVEKEKTDAGIILPEGYNKDSNPTPIAKVVAIGENARSQFANTEFDLQEGDFIYVDARFMNFAVIDGVKGLILMADGIIGKVPQNGE